MPASKEPKSGPQRCRGRIFAQASPTSVGGTSMFAGSKAITAKTVAEFRSDPRVIARAQDACAAPASTSSPRTSSRSTSPARRRPTSAPSDEAAAPWSASPEGAPRARHGRPSSRSRRRRVRGPDRHLGEHLADVVEGVAIEEPAYYFAPARAKPFPPKVDYWHLEVPGDVSLALNADVVHRDGHHRQRRQGGDVGHRLVPPPVLRAARLPREPMRCSAPAAYEAAQRRGRPRHRRVGERVRGRARHRVQDGQDGPRQPHRRLQRGGRAGAPRSSAAAGASTSARARSRRPTRRSPPAVAQAVADGDRGRVLRRQRPLRVPRPAPRRDLGRRRLHGAERQAARLELLERVREPDLLRPQGARRLAGWWARCRRRRTSCCRSSPATRSTSTSSGGNHPQRDETKRDDGWAAFAGTSAAAPQIAGVCALIKEACPALDPADVQGHAQADRARRHRGLERPPRAGGPGLRPRDRRRPGGRRGGRALGEAGAAGPRGRWAPAQTS